MVYLELGLDVLRSYKRLPYTAWHAMAEFVDNSTQSYFNNRDVLDSSLAAQGRPFEVRITYDRNGPGLLRIADDAMGMSVDELQRALRVGLPPVYSDGRSKYGLGMKMGACWFGENWSIRTKRLGETIEHTVRVNVEAVADGNGELPYEAREGVPADGHYTIIEITDLNRRPQGRTLGKIKDFLRSMYRVDLRNGDMDLYWQGEKLGWSMDEDFAKAHDGSAYRRDFQFDVDTKHVSGWVGVLERGSRSKAGFSILHANRVVKGWPDSWRPESIFGQVQGSNDLVNQRLTGEINLDAFDVSHTKDDILWLGDEEDVVQDRLAEECADYREYARTRRRDPRPITDIEVQAAVDEFQAEINSPEIIDLITISSVPSPDVVREDDAAVVSAIDPDDAAFRVSLTLGSGEVEIRGYLATEVSSNDPYVIIESTTLDRVMIVINMQHPHVQQIHGSENLLNYLRHCTYDGVAEWQARNQASTTDPATIKRLKDRLLRVPFDMEMHGG
jgi:hypothetical protein